MKIDGKYLEFLQSVDAVGYGNFYLNAEVRKLISKKSTFEFFYSGISLCWSISVSTKCDYDT